MKALIKKELRLSRTLLLIWMGIVLLLCGFAYFEYLSLRETLGELDELINTFPKILTIMFGVGEELTSTLGWYGCIYFWVAILNYSYAIYLGISCVAKKPYMEPQNTYLQNRSSGAKSLPQKPCPVSVTC